MTKKCEKNTKNDKKNAKNDKKCTFLTKIDKKLIEKSTRFLAQKKELENVLKNFWNFQKLTKKMYFFSKNSQNF